ncbi:hypothetical protein [Epibacterium ulvae]|uniref:hypothetical protein n=1 Tax=Epibacterium ulvae TaxID=1156985 RepID=UPI0024910FE3|nr:hypothetical protein [Epibacterium ulvae]
MMYIHSTQHSDINTRVYSAGTQTTHNVQSSTDRASRYQPGHAAPHVDTYAAPSLAEPSPSLKEKLASLRSLTQAWVNELTASFNDQVSQFESERQTYPDRYPETWQDYTPPSQPILEFDESGAIINLEDIKEKIKIDAQLAKTVSGIQKTDAFRTHVNSLQDFATSITASPIWTIYIGPQHFKTDAEEFPDRMITGVVDAQMRVIDTLESLSNSTYYNTYAAGHDLTARPIPRRSHADRDALRADLWAHRSSQYNHAPSGQVTVYSSILAANTENAYRTVDLRTGAEQIQADNLPTDRPEWSMSIRKEDAIERILAAFKGELR